MFKKVLYIALGVAACIALILISTPYLIAQTMEGGYKIFRPDSSGPHPAVVFMSGCTGFTPYYAPKHYERVAEQFRAKGYVVVFVDSIGRRSKTSCVEVDTLEAAGDLLAAETWLKSQPSIDPARITAIGWSFGGGAVLTALNAYKIEQTVFSRAIVYYPACGRLFQWKPKVPVLMLLAGEDNVTRNAACQNAVKESPTPDGVKVVIYPGAQHCFDISELPPKMDYMGYPTMTIGYHPQAAAAAWKEIEQFLGPAR